MYLDSFLLFQKGFIEGLNTLTSSYYVVLIVLYFLIHAAVTDIKYLKIPNKLNAAFLLARLALIPWLGFSLDNVYGAIFCFLAVLIPAMIMMHKMGGDIKMLTVLGLYLGIGLAPSFLLLCCIYNVIYWAVNKIIRNKKGNMPFAPFFLLSYITLIIIGFVI